MALRWIQLSADERDAFLGRGGTGVVAFETEAGAPPFSIPVSYGYDADAEQFYFRLAFPENAGKAAVVENAVTFVVHGETDAGWRSVVATGRLEEVTDTPYESAVLQGMWAVDIPAVDVFENPPEEMTFRYFRLVPDTLAGRREVAREREKRDRDPDEQSKDASD